MAVVSQIVKKLLAECPLLCPQYPDSGLYSANCPIIIKICALLSLTHRIFERAVSFRLPDQNLLLISSKSHACHMPTHIIFLDLEMMVKKKLLSSFYIPSQ